MFFTVLCHFMHKMIHTNGTTMLGLMYSKKIGISKHATSEINIEQDRKWPLFRCSMISQFYAHCKLDGMAYNMSHILKYLFWMFIFEFNCHFNAVFWGSQVHYWSIGPACSVCVKIFKPWIQFTIYITFVYEDYHRLKIAGSCCVEEEIQSPNVAEHGYTWQT